MKPVLTKGWTCVGLGQSIFRVRTFARSRIQLPKVTNRSYWQGGRSHRYFRLPPARKGLVFAAATSLSPIAFVQLSEKNNGGTDQTAEGRMLEASREELVKKVSEDSSGIRRAVESVVLYLDLYIWEPACTGMRFLHLVFIFVPVLLTVPAIWVGSRQKNRDNERSGTLWWYWFLVKSMERAGPAFIKVQLPSYPI